MDDSLGVAQWTDLDGVRTRFFSRGEGAAVVFIHGGEIGAPEASAIHWLDCFARLSREFRVVAFDRLGMGHTGAPLRDEDYTLAASSAHAMRLIKTVLGGKVHLVAHGSGARIALELCLGPDIEVASCCILNSATVTPGVTEILPRPTWTGAWDDDRQVREHFRSLCAPHAAIHPLVLEAARAVRALDAMQQARAKMWDAGLRMRVYLRELGAGRGGLFRRIMDVGVRAPLLLINGIDDPLVSDECAALFVSALAAKQDDVELRLLADCGHYPQLEKGEIVAGSIAGFVRQHAA